ncbi:MAG: OmpH family outer membrane protein [Planctomycetes bacterium]|nr:OmpH family outer membrane protein [Planctomycetota bacterium]MBL7007632.1 OmpH family outer membrane protein [Planctomycetota bacterium]
MKSLAPLILVLAAALFAAGGLLADRSAPDPGPGVRYVDLQRCLDSYAVAQEELVQMGVFADGRKAEFEKRRTALLARKEDLRTMDPGSEAFVNEGYRIQSAETQLQSDVQFAQQRLQLRESDLLVRTWLAVQRAAAQVGAREGFGAVVVVPKDMDSALLQQPNAALEALQNRNLLWANPSYDVSELVIEVLNRG